MKIILEIAKRLGRMSASPRVAINTNQKNNMKIESAQTRIYNEGRKAFLNGEDFFECPHTGYYFDVWVSGYNAEKSEH